MAEVKITKAMVLEAIMSSVKDADVVYEVDANGETVEVTGKDILDYCAVTLDQLERKLEKAKERAAKTKEKGDELREAVFECITEEYQTADAITELIEGFEDITKAKVVARLTQLVKAGKVVKEQRKVDDRKVMTYALADAE